MNFMTRFQQNLIRLLLVLLAPLASFAENCPSSYIPVSGNSWDFASHGGTATNPASGDFLVDQGILHLATLPYDNVFTDAITNGQSIVEYSSNKLAGMISDSWDKIKQQLCE